MPGHDYMHARWAQRHGQGWWGVEGPPEWRMPRWATLWLPVLVSFALQVPAAIIVSRVAGLGPRDSALSILIALVGPLALIAARRFPGPVVAFTAVAASLDLFVNENGGPPYVALAFAILSAVVRGQRIWAWISIGACWIGTITIAGIMGRAEWTPFRIAGTTLGILIVFGIGEGLRSRRERASEYRRLASERRQSTVQAERVRIARELHDVLAHSLSQINVQAGVGLHLMDKQPEKAKEALASIKETSKTALDEVRSVLGMLRAEGSPVDAPLVPEPDLDRLPSLISTASTASVTVHLVDRLAHAEIPAQAQLAMYRIVQESLTNVARHASGAKRVDVELERAGDSYRVSVRDDGRAAAETASEAGGRGLLGMRERAELLGGHLSAGPADGGGFVVSAEIPVA
ncbi:MAG TPA: sensor histidine kinase [Pseudolysinimonas sp.]|nr:sensor histidine kinase [Pseudolysinimonas sp.]